MSKEAQARIKINKLLEESGWRFDADGNGSANIQLEAGVRFEDLGDDFENAQTHDKRRGAIDFLLLDKDGRPLVVVVVPFVLMGRGRRAPQEARGHA